MEALRTGAVDLAFGPFQTRADVSSFMAEYGLEFLYTELLPDDGVGMAVCKGNEGLLLQLDTALAAIAFDGTLAMLENRWFE
jgi:polar amino acid transport system substrate-binding protein